MRYLILFCTLFFSAPAFAQSTAEAPPPIRALLEFCLPALVKGEAPADFASRARLLAFPSEQAAKFAPDGGSVFAIPYAKGNAVLTTSKDYKGVCSVAVRETQKDGFLQAINKWFGPETPFKLLREKRIDEERVTRREYQADIGGPITFLVSVSDVPRPHGMQALMTIARIQKKQP